MTEKHQKLVNRNGKKNNCIIFQDFGGARVDYKGKWTQQHEFKSWTRLIAFHIALIPLGKVWIKLFSLQLWVNDRLGSSALVWQLVKEKEYSEFKPVKPHLKIGLVSYPARAEGLLNMIIFQDLSYCTWGGKDMAEKVKHEEINRISVNSNTK